MPTFVLNDENVLTAHGFYVSNTGGNLERFRLNPVMLDSHNENRVIGRWCNLRSEGGKLLADTDFDKEDPEAMKVAGKIERGFIKGASMGIKVDDAEMMQIPGKGYCPVVTRWELLEASPVAVPSNASSLRLYAPDGSTLLKAEEIRFSVESLIKQKTTMDKIQLSVEAAKALEVSREPEASELNAAIMELHARAVKAESDKTTAEGILASHRQKLAADLVDGALKAGKITADKKDSFVKLATSDFEQAKSILDTIPGKETFSDRTSTGGKADHQGWDYMRWLKEDPKGLSAMKENNPEGFAKLKAEYKPKH